MNSTGDDKKIRIARIIARLNVGGPARHVVWLNEALNNDEFESILIAGTVPVGEEDMSYFASGRNVTPEYVEEMSRELSPLDLVALFKIWRKLVRFRPDIVHTHTAKAGTLGRISAFFYRWFTPAVLIGRPRKLRVFHTFHGHIFHGYYGSLKTKVFLAVERLLAKTATDKIIVISSQQLEEINVTYGVGSRKQFEIIPLGLDLEALNWTEDTNELRNGIGVSENEILVGIVGRLTEIKNHKLFIDAAKRFEETSDFSHVRFVIIGDGSLRSELEEYAAGSGVVFAGNLDNAAEFYAALNLVVLTSRNEGTPLTLIEAMAAGKPWAATSVGGVVDLAGPQIEDRSGFGVQGSESVEQSSESKSLSRRLPNSELQTQNSEQIRFSPRIAVCERGVLFESGNSDACFAAIRVLLENEELRDRLGIKGTAFVQEKYAKERLIADITGLYKSKTP